MFNKRKDKIIAKNEEDWNCIYHSLISKGYFYVGERNKDKMFIVDKRRRTLETAKENLGGFLYDILRFKKRSNKQY